MIRQIGIWMVCLAMCVGCTGTQKVAAIGAGSGAVLGGIIGHQTDDDVAGAAIGAAVGGIGGALIGNQLEKKFCPTCGKSYTDGTQFCPEDGTELKDKQ